MIYINLADIVFEFQEAFGKFIFCKRISQFIDFNHTTADVSVVLDEINTEDKQALLGTEYGFVEDNTHYRFCFPSDKVRLNFFVTKNLRTVVCDIHCLEINLYHFWSCMYIIISWMFIYFGRIVLHSSLIEYRGFSIAFMAPSHTGKSTQARLWERLRGARIINHDTPFFSVNETGVYAYGSPWSGSDECYIRSRSKLRALLLIEQAKNEPRIISNENACIDMTKLIPHCRSTMTCIHDVVEVINILHLLQENTIIIHMACTVDENSIEILENEIMHV